jgi:hypothetical protein
MTKQHSEKKKKGGGLSITMLRYYRRSHAYTLKVSNAVKRPKITQYVIQFAFKNWRSAVWRRRGEHGRDG